MGGFGSNVFVLFHMQLFCFGAIKGKRSVLVGSSILWTNPDVWTGSPGSGLLHSSSSMKTTVSFNFPMRAPGRPALCLDFSASLRQQVCLQLSPFTVTLLKRRLTHSFIQRRAAGRQSGTVPSPRPASLLPSHSFLHGHSERSSEPVKEQSGQPRGRSRQDPRRLHPITKVNVRCSFWDLCWLMSVTWSSRKVWLFLNARELVFLVMIFDSV